jgi:hypothetical protein
MKRKVPVCKEKSEGCGVGDRRGTPMYTCKDMVLLGNMTAVYGFEKACCIAAWGVGRCILQIRRVESALPSPEIVTF